VPSSASSLRSFDGSNWGEDLSAVRQRITDGLSPIASVVVRLPHMPFILVLVVLLLLFGGGGYYMGPGIGYYGGGGLSLVLLLVILFLLFGRGRGRL
jgi:hypothetical protein